MKLPLLLITPRIVSSPNWIYEAPYSFSRWIIRIIIYYRFSLSEIIFTVDSGFWASGNGGVCFWHIHFIYLLMIHSCLIEINKNIAGHNKIHLSPLTNLFIAFAIDFYRIFIPIANEIS